jgi:flagellar basal body-associated protein FliL
MTTSTPGMTPIYDWGINNKKNRGFLVILIISIIMLTAIPIAVTPMVYPFIYKIGLWAYTIMWVALIISIIVIHEGLHGLFFYLYSKHVNFGIRWKTKVGPTPYATANGQLFTKRQYQMVAIAPQIMTLAVIFAIQLLTNNLPAVAIIIMIAAINLGGGCADLWCVYQLQRFPDDILVEDTKDGFKVWAKIPKLSSRQLGG